jgi:hemoglobin-like flavoprotein
MLRKLTPTNWFRFLSPRAQTESVEASFHSDVHLLKESFALVITRCPDFAHRLYDVLFARYPRTKALFTREIDSVQERMLSDVLLAVVDHLDDPPWLEANMTVLGSRHVAYGVTDEMYDWFGESLLATLAEIAGADWTLELERAWADAYGRVAALMKRGAKTAQA